MAKLHFYYSSMNAGKTTMLLQSIYNYEEKGMLPILFSLKLYNKTNINKIISRIGLKRAPVIISLSFNLYKYMTVKKIKSSQTMCVFIDEAQFLSKKHVFQLINIVDKLNIPVLTYGLRTDFLGNPFVGSLYLILLSDNLIEVKTICFCGKKAIMNIRLNILGLKALYGKQFMIGGNELYKSVCRIHHLLYE